MLHSILYNKYWKIIYSIKSSLQDLLFPTSILVGASLTVGTGYSVETLFISIYDLFCKKKSHLGQRGNYVGRWTGMR